MCNFIPIMTNSDAKKILKELGRKYAWLARETGYALNTINNRLAGECRELPADFANECKKIFDRENFLRDPNLQHSPDTESIWDDIYFTAAESIQNDHAAKLLGFNKISDYYKFAIKRHTEQVLKGESANDEKAKKTA